MLLLFLIPSIRKQRLLFPFLQVVVLLSSWIIICGGIINIQEVNAAAAEETTTVTPTPGDNSLRGGGGRGEEDDNASEFETTRIIGGTDVTYDSDDDDDPDDFRYPYYVLLFGSHVCGGILIAPTLVVTAAHCEDGTNVARIGSSRFIGNEVNTNVEHIEIIDKVIHPEFGSSFVFSNDIMLLKLAEPSNKQYARLNSNSNLPEDLQNLIVLGMGHIIIDDNGAITTTSTDTNPQDLFPTQLQSTEVQYVNHVECQNMHIFGAITNDMICAYDFDEGSGPCNGDSGGPLLMTIENDDDDDNDDDTSTTTTTTVVVGLVSWGRGCASIDKPPTVYVSISYFYNWIIETSCSLTTTNDILPTEFGDCSESLRYVNPTTTQQPSQQPTSSVEPTSQSPTVLNDDDEEEEDYDIIDCLFRCSRRKNKR